MLRRALIERARRLPSLRFLAPRSVGSVTAKESGAVATLGDGARLQARLVAAAEGKESPLRQAAGIRTVEWRYKQTGIVTTVAHERPHAGIAIELAARFGDFLGTIAPVGPRWAYPLSLMQAERYIACRLALVGEAAHVIHPIAGQGLNVGIRDVAALAEAVIDARRLGLDIGDDPVLERYQRWRRLDAVLLAGVTDGLNRLFSNRVAPVKLIRGLGLAAVNRMPPLKRLLMQHAMGTLGDRPRLARGERL